MAPPQPAHAHAFDLTGRAALDTRCHHGTEKHQIAEAHSHSSSAFLVLRERMTLPIRVLHMPIHDQDKLRPLKVSFFNDAQGAGYLLSRSNIELGAG